MWHPGPTVQDGMMYAVAQPRTQALAVGTRLDVVRPM